MTEPQKTTRRRSGSRSRRETPIVLGTPDNDDNGKVKKAASAIEELSTPVMASAAPPPPPPAGPDGSSAAEAAGTEVPIEQLQQQLLQELNNLIGRLKELSPAFTPAQMPGAAGVMSAVQDILGKTNFEKVRSVAGDVLDIDTWKGAWYIVSQTAQLQVNTAKRRLHGEYETDEWGFDPEVLDAVQPFFEFLYRKYWRVSMTGLDYVPKDGRALFVVNHSGQLPFDGAMLATGVRLDHPANRLVRTMYATWFPTVPFVSDILVKCGQVLATEDNGTRLLEQGELVSVFPEGYKGVGKLYKDRYKLARFGRGGFIRMALKSQASILPVAVVGAEETYMSIAKSDLMAKLIGFPFFPITPTFPWLGLLGTIPMPTKWYIDVGEPVPMAGYGPKADQNLLLVSQLTDQVRGTVQKMINDRLAQRPSVFRA